MLTLYYAPGTCALASHIALEDAGADYRAERIDFASEDQLKPEYLAINPKGRVPSLITEHGVLTETPAILAYIAQRFPAADLAPQSDPFAFARAQEFNSYLCATVHVPHAHKSRGKRWVDDPAAIAEMQRKLPESVFKVFDLIEQGMLQGAWVMGQRYSMCDAYLYTVARWLEGDGIDPEKQLPRVAEHRARMAERASVRAALAQQYP